MENIASEDLLYLLEGAALLGSGGGGSLAAGRAFIQLIQAHETQIKLITEFESGINACVICDIGAITSLEANQSQALINAFQALDKDWQQRGNAPLTAVMPIETGPENTLAALVVAVLLGLDVFDGDGGGRAVPKLSLCSFSEAGLSPCPATIANDQQDSLVVQTPTAESLDDLLRPITSNGAFGNSASLALWPGDGQQLAKASIPGAISLALQTGKLLYGLVQTNTLLVEESYPTVNQLSGWLIGQGTVSKVNQSVNGAFDFGQIIIKDSEHTTDLTILTQNENLIVYSNQAVHPVACAPDSIAYLTSTGRAITNSEIKAGDEVFILGILAHERLKTPLIQQGFQVLLQELGFAGSTQLPMPAYQPLGNLLKELLKGLSNQS